MSAHGGVAVVNHCAIVNLLRVVNLLRRSIFSTAGSFGCIAQFGKLDFGLLAWLFANLTLFGLVCQNYSFLLFLGPKNVSKNLLCTLCKSFLRSLRVVDVSAPRIMDIPNKKCVVLRPPVTGRNSLHPGVMVGNVYRKYGPLSLCLCCAFFPDYL